jgi:uncharacterized protein
MPTFANALAIMAKAPLPGTVKTRLVPPLTAEQAAELYRALLVDQFEQLNQVDSATRYVFYAPAGAEEVLRELGGFGYTYQAQSDGDLGARMEQVFAMLWRLGHRNIVLIGSDLPALPLQILNDAFMRLARKEVRVVLGPSRDGGYYLIGMNQLAPEIFDNMTWSHDRVLADTTVRLDGLGLSYSMLPTWFDLDVAEDFQQLRTLPRSALRRTLGCLEKFGFWPASKD